VGCPELGKKKFAKFGGLDLAKRTDNSALVILTLKEGILYHTAHKIWPHVDYKTQVEDLIRIQEKERMNKIGVDRTGVGDAVMDMFPHLLRKTCKQIVMTMPKKLEIIDVVQSLFQSDKLKLHPSYSVELVEEILAQERSKTDAGNIIYKHPPGAHDDRFWALAYACYTASPYIAGVPIPTLAVSEPFRQSFKQDIINI